MLRYLKVASAIAALFVLLVAMARLSGFLLLPLALVLILAIGYVAVQIMSGTPSPYPRIASGVFERTESTAVQLSETGGCHSCTDREGRGERQTTCRDLVFLGVPLVRLSTKQVVLCEVCADPLAATEDYEADAIDRELEADR